MVIALRNWTRGCHIRAFSPSAYAIDDQNQKQQRSRFPIFSRIEKYCEFAIETIVGSIHKDIPRN
jgi:hypothetical protein